MVVVLILRLIKVTVIFKKFDGETSVEERDELEIVGNWTKLVMPMKKVLQYS